MIKLVALETTVPRTHYAIPGPHNSDRLFLGIQLRLVMAMTKVFKI